MFFYPIAIVYLHLFLNSLLFSYSATQRQKCEIKLLIRVSVNARQGHKKLLC